MSEDSGKPPPIPGKRPDPTRFETYHTIAETVGGVPSFRKKDNLVQGITILACTLVAAAAGWFLRGPGAALGLGLAGMIGSLLVSGVVLMILGWVRAAKK